MTEDKDKTQAVALKYDMEEDDAPKIIASGIGVTAENILERAREKDIPLHKDDKLIKQLIQYKVGTEIPPELYEVVAQILIFVDMVDGEKAL